MHVIAFCCSNLLLSLTLAVGLQLAAMDASDATQLAADPERRLAENGRPYTRIQFLEYYGSAGELRWTEAEDYITNQQEHAAGGPPADRDAAQPGMGLQPGRVPESSEVSADSLAATSASQPSASSCSGDARGSDVGAPQPGISRSNISPIVTEVLKFKRIPKKIKRPRTKEQREEIVCKVLKSTADSALSELDFDTLDKIIWFCATSPMAQHNQIANTSRRLNMVWRTMHRTVMTDMVWGAIGAASHGNARCQHGNHMILVDLLDIM